MRASRLAGLDLLRALAVLLVIGRHASPRLTGDASPWQGVFEVWQRGGWVGVDLFFVLSGFLIAGVLFTEHRVHGRIDYGRFLLRRGCKIYPAFWVLLATTAAYGCYVGRPPSGAQLASELLYVQNYWPGWLPHTWSLAVEEHFYLVLPLLLLWLGGRRAAPPSSGVVPFAALPSVVFGIAVACLSLRCITANGHTQFDHYRHLFPTHLRIDSLLFGVLLSWAWHCGGRGMAWLRRAPRSPCTLAGIALLAPAFVLPLERSWFLHTFGVVLCYLGSGLLLLAALGLSGSGRMVRGLAWIGAHSYSIYLWHIPVRIASDRLLAAAPASLQYTVYLLGSLVLGVVMGKLVETPVLRLRDRWFPSRAAAAPPRTGLPPGELPPTGLPPADLLPGHVVLVDEQRQVHGLRQQDEERQDAEAEHEADGGGQQFLGIDGQQLGCTHGGRRG
jgi:peptidoglycan/LPS O-acetylase OafA/YrhL